VRYADNNRTQYYEEIIIAVRCFFIPYFVLENFCL